jgi:hypothetical protein
MRHILKIAQNVPVLPLHNALMRNPTLWNRYPERAKPGSPHEEVDDVWVRCRARSGWDPKHPEKFLSNHDSVWYPEYLELKHAIDPLVFPLMQSVQADRLGGILITRVPSGKEVKPHIDVSWHASYYDKYAIQVAAHPEQAWHNEDGSMVTAPGDVYWFANNVQHWVTNTSPVDRITLIVCLHHAKSIPQT